MTVQDAIKYYDQPRVGFVPCEAMQTLINYAKQMTADEQEAEDVFNASTKLIYQGIAAIREAGRAAAKHAPMHSHHEAYGVITEEYREYEAEVFKGGSVPRDPAALRAELVQTAAMCLRALHDLC